MTMKLLVLLAALVLTGCAAIKIASDVASCATHPRGCD
jgi:uncharacterized lipoprotein YajG